MHLGRDRRPGLGGVEQALGATVPALDPGVRRVTPDRVMLEVVGDERSVRGGRAWRGP